jgi:hypothetical protein
MENKYQEVKTQAFVNMETKVVEWRSYIIVNGEKVWLDGLKSGTAVKLPETKAKN